MQNFEHIKCHLYLVVLLQMQTHVMGIIIKFIDIIERTCIDNARECHYQKQDPAGVAAERWASNADGAYYVEYLKKNTASKLGQMTLLPQNSQFSPF